MSAYEQGLLLARQGDAEHGPAPRGTADMYVGMSEVHRERGDLETARQCLRSSRQLGEYNGLPQNGYRWSVAMAGVRESDGDLEAAVALLDEAALSYTADFSPDVRPVSALRARVLVKQGRLDEAFAWAAETAPHRRRRACLCTRVRASDAGQDARRAWPVAGPSARSDERRAALGAAARGGGARWQDRVRPAGAGPPDTGPAGSW
jgi:hypothetical protein